MCGAAHVKVKVKDALMAVARAVDEAAVGPYGWTVPPCKLWWPLVKHGSSQKYTSSWVPRKLPMEYRGGGHTRP